MGCTSSMTVVAEENLKIDNTAVVSKVDDPTRKARMSTKGYTGSKTGDTEERLKKDNTSVNMAVVSKVNEPTRKARMSTKGHTGSKTGDAEERHKKDNTSVHTAMFSKVDDHARNAPSSLRNSVEDLVTYLSTPSKDSKMLVRAFFVWITENVRYDTDGYFGRSARSPCDAESVMRTGKSVCAGYANVMETLCRQANINVKTLSGYAKGYGRSLEQPITTNMATDHAWNAVEINGKWHLVDSTWGAGHLSEDVFTKKFNDHYFLTDPRQFVTDHFPYIDGDMEGSKKWQLLNKPISLEQYSKALKCCSQSFKLGVRPVSHTDTVINMKNEVELEFAINGKYSVEFSTTLYYKEGNMLKETQRKTLGKVEKNKYKLLVHPHSEGTYRLRIFGKKSTDEGPFPELFQYNIRCSGVKDADFEYLQGEKAADEFGVKAISHPYGLIKVENEVELTFKSSTKITYIEKLFIKDGNTLFEKRHSVFGRMDHGLYKLRVHPNMSGTFHLKLFGKREADSGSCAFLFQYILKCSRVDDDDFEFPETYTQFQVDQCQLIEPLRNKLPRNSEVKFRLSSPSLQRIMVGKTLLQRQGKVFEGIVETGQSGTLSVYGSRTQEGSLSGLLKFDLK